MTTLLSALPLPLPRPRFLSLLLYGLPLYILLCRVLRHRRVRRAHAFYLREKGYGRHDPSSTADTSADKSPSSPYAHMTATDALYITKYVRALEFPATYKRSLDFALFRTYGIPTVSSLLLKTGQLTDPRTASKRIADTVVLTAEFLSSPPESERHCAAVARMNYIHSVYQRSGAIKEADLLYTLALFALEPVRWIGMYEWRSLTEMEICAHGVLWKATGDAMGITYGALKSGSSGFRDGLHWIEELREWAEAYEAEKMVPDASNAKVAAETTAYLLDAVPGPLKGVGRKCVSSLMDERLRRAMLIPDPPAMYPRAIQAALAVRKFLLRYLALPRPESLAIVGVSKDPDPKTGRMFLEMDMDKPWYAKPTLYNRFGPGAWFAWATGRPWAGSDAKYFPEGYLIPEVGPALFKGKGKAEFEKTKSELMGSDRGGCPFSG